MLAKRKGEATVSKFCGDVSTETAVEEKDRNFVIDFEVWHKQGLSLSKRLRMTSEEVSF